VEGGRHRDRGVMPAGGFRYLGDGAHRTSRPQHTRASPGGYRSRPRDPSGKWLVCSCCERVEMHTPVGAISPPTTNRRRSHLNTINARQDRDGSPESGTDRRRNTCPSNSPAPTACHKLCYVVRPRPAFPRGAGRALFLYPGLVLTLMARPEQRPCGHRGVASGPTSLPSID